MNWDAIGAVGQVVGSVGVLATLIYLARQVRDSNRVAAFTAVVNNRAERRQYLLANRDSPYLPALEAKVARGDGLDTEEAQRYQFHLAAYFGLLYSNWVSLDLGLMGEYTPQLSFYLNQLAQRPAHTAWWQATSRQLYPPRFCDYVDRELARRRDATTQNDVNHQAEGMQ